jgi:hypothetical protein
MAAFFCSAGIFFGRPYRAHAGDFELRLRKRTAEAKEKERCCVWCLASAIVLRRFVGTGDIFTSACRRGLCY